MLSSEDVFNYLCLDGNFVLLIIKYSEVPLNIWTALIYTRFSFNFLHKYLTLPERKFIKETPKYWVAEVMLKKIQKTQYHIRIPHKMSALSIVEIYFKKKTS